jgi:hypothetical protein
MSKAATKTTKTAAKTAAKTAKPAAAAKAVKKTAPAKAAPKAKAAWGATSTIIFELAMRKQGMTAAEIKAATGWKSVSAKAIAERFAPTWGKVENDGKPFKVEQVNRGEGEPVAYRFKA